MNDVPRVSVILPVYNAEQFVAEAVLSILGQSFSDFELIAIDDGSTDRSAAILDSLAAKDARIIVLRQSNSGLIATLNRGCASARGQYLARMDADDVSLPERLRTQVQYLENHPEIGIVGTWFQDISAGGTAGRVWPLPAAPAVVQWFLMFGDCIAHPSIMARSGVFRELGYYNSDALHVEDYDLWIRACAVTKIANIRSVLLRYRFNAGSVSAQNIGIQNESALKLQQAFISRLLNIDVTEGQPVKPSLLLKIYSEYRKKIQPSPGDEAEIALDVLRRLYLSSGPKPDWVNSLRLLSRVCSLQGIRRVLQLGFSLSANIRHGFVTQRRPGG